MSLQAKTCLCVKYQCLFQGGGGETGGVQFPPFRIPVGGGDGPSTPQMCTDFLSTVQCVLYNINTGLTITIEFILPLKEGLMHNLN